jgi:hypothetical protein
MGAMNDKALQRVYAMKFSKVYPLYVQKVERKERTQAEVDQVIRWLTGYTQAGLQKQIRLESSIEEFFAQAPKFNPKSSLIKGVVCGVRVEEVVDPVMRKVRYLDKLIDELAQGRSMEKVLRE